MAIVSILNDNYVLQIFANEQEKKIVCQLRELERDDEGHCLDQLKKIIGADFVGCHVVQINGTEYDLWYDDEFMSKGPQFISWLELDKDNSPSMLLMGTVIVAKSDHEGNTIGMTEAEAKQFLKAYNKTMSSRTEAYRRQREGE